MTRTLLVLLASLFIVEAASAQQQPIRRQAGFVVTNADGTPAAQLTGSGLVLGGLTTAERDAIASPVAGQIIYNSTTGQLEEYDGASWSKLSGDLSTIDGNADGAADDAEQLDSKPPGYYLDLTNASGELPQSQITDLPGDLASKASAAYPVKSVATAAYTLVSGDDAKRIRLDLDGAQQVRLPAPSTASLTDRLVYIYSNSTGTKTLLELAGAALAAGDSCTLDAENENMVLGAVDNSTWEVLSCIDGSSAGGTDDQTAAEVSVADAGGYYTGTEVEAMGQEIGADLATKAPLDDPTFTTGVTTPNLTVTSSLTTQDEVIFEAGFRASGGDMSLTRSVSGDAILGITSTGTHSGLLMQALDGLNERFAIEKDGTLRHNGSAITFLPDPSTGTAGQVLETNGTNYVFATDDTGGGGSVDSTAIYNLTQIWGEDPSTPSDSARLGQWYTMMRSGAAVDSAFYWRPQDSTAVGVPLTVVGNSTTLFAAGDVTAPTITNYTVGNPAGQTVRVQFNSDETLVNIEASVTGAETATLTEADFSETGGLYTANYAGSTDGTYTVTLTIAEDAAGNNGAAGENAQVVVNTSAPAFDTEVLADSPVLFLDFEETSGTTATNEGSAGADGTYTNSPTLNVASGAGVGLGFDTDGAVSAGSHVIVPWYTEINFTSNSHTFELWCDFDVGTECQATSRGAGNKGWKVGMAADGTVELAHYGVATYASAAGEATAELNGTGAEQLVITLDGTTGNFYVNGTLTWTTTIAAPLSTASAVGEEGDVIIAAQPSNDNVLEDNDYNAQRTYAFAVYPTVLTAQRILDHYNAGN